MKRTYVLLAGLFLAIAVLLGGAGAAQAYSFHSGNNVTLSANKPVNDTIYASGRTVDISSEVYGDVFCAGLNVTVSGTIHGDVICAGQSVSVTGTVDGDVRLAGQNVILDGTVSGNATIAGQTFVLQSKGSVGGDITAGSADTTLNGSVARDAVVGGESLIIGGKVGRDIKAGANTMQLTPSAQVGGNIDLTSPNQLQKAPGATVSGTVTHTNPPKETTDEKSGAVFGLSFAWCLYLFAAMLFTALALALLFPRLLLSATNTARPRPWKSLLVGFVAGFALPIIIFTLVATLIGIPLAIILALAWVIILFLSGPVFAYYLGRLVLRRPRHALLTMLVGASILAVLYLVPIIGGIAVLAAVWMGSGMLLLDMFHRTPRPAYEPVAGSAAAPSQPKKAR